MRIHCFLDYINKTKIINREISQPKGEIKMKKRWIVFIILVFFFNLNILTIAEFILAPIDPELTKDDVLPIMPLVNRMEGYKKDISFDKVPNEMSKEAWYGIMNIDKDNKVKFAVYSSVGKHYEPDTIIFDSNNDEDLTNDKKFTGFSLINRKEIEFELPNGRCFKAKLELMQGSITIQPLQWWKGSVILNGEKINAALIDWDGEGLSLRHSKYVSKYMMDYLLLDLNNNSKFDIDCNTFIIREAFNLQNEIPIGGKLYSVKLNTVKPNIELLSYNGKQGKLALDIGFPVKLDQLAFYYQLRGTEKPYILSASLEDFPIAMLEDEYVIRKGYNEDNGTILLKDKSGQCAWIIFSLGQPITIKDNETTTISLGYFKPLMCILKKEGEILSVDKSLFDETGTEYINIIPISEHKMLKDIVPNNPLVEIFDEENNLLSKGNLEYNPNTKRFVRYKWRIPNHFLESGRVKIQLSWDTGIFGILKAEKWWSKEGMKVDISSEENIRETITEVKKDLHHIAVGLEAYFIDKRGYPNILYTLTSPTVYIVGVFEDPFNKNLEPLQYILNKEKSDWAIYSFGPDQEDDRGSVVYDPTNGIISKGDILMTK